MAKKTDPDALIEVRVVRPVKTPSGVTLRPGQKARLKQHVIDALGTAVQRV